MSRILFAVYNLDLLDKFLDGKGSARDFQTRYLDAFKHEKHTLSAPVFELLDTLFADVDAFCADAALLAELERLRPGFYIDEGELSRRVKAAAEALRAIGR